MDHHFRCWTARLDAGREVAAQMLSGKKINILDIDLVVQLRLQAMSQLGFDLDCQADLHVVIEKSKPERVNDQRLLLEELDESHEDAGF